MPHILTHHHNWWCYSPDLCTLHAATQTGWQSGGGLHLVKETTLARVLRWVRESLWASTTCSISHILSHLRGHISSGPQPNYSTTRLTAIKRCTAGVQGSRTEPGLLPWPLSLSRFPRMGRDRESALIGSGTILTNRDRASTHNNHRHCCYAIEQLEYAHLWILAGFRLEACQQEWMEANCSISL